MFLMWQIMNCATHVCSIKKKGIQRNPERYEILV